MSFEKIVVDDYGQIAQLTFIDVDTALAADISAYSDVIQMAFTNPIGTVSTKTATFDTDGSDGVIEYTIVSALLDTVGDWKVRGKVTSGTAVLSSELHGFHVDP